MNIYAHKGRVRASVQCECADGWVYVNGRAARCSKPSHGIAARINAARVPADLLVAMRSGESGPGQIDWTLERMPLFEAEPRLWSGELGGVVIIGELNGGKSHTAAWLLRQAVELGMSARWITSRAFDREVKDTFGDSSGSSSAVIAKYTDVPVLVIDELKAASLFTSELLGEVIGERYARSQGGDVHPTIITANGCPSNVLEPHIWQRLTAMAPSFRMDTSGQRGVAA